MSPFLLRRAVLTGAAAIAVGAAGASEAAAQTTAPAGVARPQILSIQPLGIPALFFAGEYERVADANVTVGFGASYWSPSELTFTSLDVKARFYPGGVPLKGFAVGATAGFLRVGEEYDESYCDPQFEDCDAGDETISGATLGVQVDYQWLVGRDGKYAIAVGAGAKRFLGKSDNVDDFSVVYPTVRLSFGIAF